MNYSNMAATDMLGLSLKENITLKSDNHGSQMLKSFYTAYMEDRYCDVTLNVGDFQLSVHKLVLIGLSDYFKVLFQADRKDTTEINLHEVDAETLKTIVKFAYTGDLEVKRTNIHKLMISANFYQISSIQVLCEEHIKQDVTVDNCVEFLKFADTYGFDELKSLCIKLIANNFEYVCFSNAFLEIRAKLLIEIIGDNNLVVLRNKIPILHAELELVLLRGVMRYINGNTGGKQVAGDILRCVRLPQIREEDLNLELQKWQVLYTCPGLVQTLKLLELKDSEKYPEKWTKIRLFTNFALEEMPNVCSSTGHIFDLSDGRIQSTTDSNDVSILENIISIELFFRRWDDRQVISGFNVLYDSGKKKKYGGTASGNTYISSQTVHLHPGERIIKIGGASGWVLDRFIFHTSEDRVLGPFGGDGGVEFTSHLLDKKLHGYLHGFTGTNITTQSHPAIVQVGFVWKYYDVM